MPGFTAETSLGKTSERYQLAADWTSRNGKQAVAMQAEEIDLHRACREYNMEVNTCDWGDKNDQKACRVDRTYAISLCVAAGGLGSSCWPHWSNTNMQGYECHNEGTRNAVRNYLWFVEGKDAWSDPHNAKKLYVRI